MADYYSPTVIQQMIAEADMTPLERLLLSHIFESERDGEGWYFFSESGPTDMIMVERAALESALEASELDVDCRDELSLDPDRHVAEDDRLFRVVGLRDRLRIGADADARRRGGAAARAEARAIRDGGLTGRAIHRVTISLAGAR